MTARGVIFTDHSVRAILAGRKTQTRRIIPTYAEGAFSRSPCIVGDTYLSPAKVGYDVGSSDFLEMARCDCPYGFPRYQNQLIVREAWRTYERPGDMVDGIRYRADDAFVPIRNTTKAAEAWVVAHNNDVNGDSWRPSLFMPRWTSRIKLRVTEVRVQRLQDIGEVDSQKELGTHKHFPTSKAAFEDLWDSINGDRASWSENPWVWAVTFEVAEVRKELACPADS